MRRRFLATIPAVLAPFASIRASSASSPSAAHAGGDTTSLYLPQVAQSAQFPAALPDGETSIAIPFTVLDSCPIDPVPLLDGSGRWLIVAFRVDSGAELNGGYQLLIDPLARTATPRGARLTDGGADAQDVSTSAIGRISPTRLTQVRGPDGRVSVWWWDTTTGRSRTLKIRVTP